LECGGLAPFYPHAERAWIGFRAPRGNKAAPGRRTPKSGRRTPKRLYCIEVETNLLIIGAGPFGLAVAAQAAHDGAQYLIVGRPMEFWRRNMPKGMFLRSACDWHLDPLNLHTIEKFLESQGKTAHDVEPLSLEFYLTYADWFQQQKNIQPLPIYIRKLDRSTTNDFIATTIDGDAIHARRVVLAPGFKHFINVPDYLKQRLPAGRYEHTCNFNDFSDSAGKRYLIIGGRQSAFEWAALLLEAGAAAVHLVHRHDSPAFAAADWSWVNPLVDAMVQNPNWFRNLSQEQKDHFSHKLWAEGRLKVEPWLEHRLSGDRVHVWPRSEVSSAIEQDNGDLEVKLSNGETIVVDRIILATGYKMNIAQLPLLASGNILNELKTRDGFPELNDHFETSVPGLFITSMPATQDFGPFFGFTIAVRTSARLICAAL
jgi:cation diffusion facilitator CzcD-associated flavoprotein CzcO